MTTAAWCTAPRRLRRNAPPRPTVPSTSPPRRCSTYRTADGYDLRLTRYHGGDRGPVVLVHGMGANPLTYTLDTIEPNLVEYLVGHEFDVWLQEWRGSTALPSRSKQFDADQVARFDHPAAEAAIRAETGQAGPPLGHPLRRLDDLDDVDARRMGHAGVARPVAGGCPPGGTTADQDQGGIWAPNVLRALGVKLLTTDSYDDESFGARVFDQVLRLYPVPNEERCDAAVCRRLAFIYGIAVHHAAVDEETHESLHELFGITDMTMMAHLGRCCPRGAVGRGRRCRRLHATRGAGRACR